MYYGISFKVLLYVIIGWYVNIFFYFLNYGIILWFDIFLKLVGFISFFVIFNGFSSINIIVFCEGDVEIFYVILIWFFIVVWFIFLYVGFGFFVFSKYFSFGIIY